MVEYCRISAREQARLHQFGKKVLPAIFCDMLGSRREFGKEIFCQLISKNWKFGCLRDLSQNAQCERSHNNSKKGEEFVFLSQMVRQNCQEETTNSGTHSKARANRKERGSQWRTSRRTRRVSTDKIDRWRWSPQRFLVYSRWLQVSSSHLNFELNLMCLRMKHSYSTEIHWCCEGQRTQIWTWCKKKTFWWSLERRWKQKFVRFMDRIHKIQSIERDTSEKMYVVRGETDKNSDDNSTRSCFAWSVVQNWKKTVQRGEKQEWAIEETKLDNARSLRIIYYIDLDDAEQKCEEKVGKAYGRRRAMQEKAKCRTGNRSDLHKSQSIR